MRKKNIFSPVFMGNRCGCGYCKDTRCDICPLFTPTAFGIKVPKWLGRIGFKIECSLLYRHMKSEGYFGDKKHNKNQYLIDV